MATLFKGPRLVAAAALLLATSGRADPIHAVEQGAFQHHDSGWVFPLQVAGFVRVGTPQDVDGSRDAVAYYVRLEEGVRSSASVDVYPKDSAVGAITLIEAEVAHERESSAAAAKKVRTKLELRKQPALTAAKTSYTASNGTTNVYLVANGEWLVKIRISSAKLPGQVLDDFARQQRWDTLGDARTD